MSHNSGLFFLHDDRIDNDYPEGASGAKMDMEGRSEAESGEEDEPIEKPTEGSI